MSPDDETPPPADHLATYRAKRSADRSPEPVGSISAIPGRLFVVHKHAARQLHFDLRLEMDGVLRSWAVPRGPSYDQADKRLAVKVEDHPLEYADFEGVIPEGNYGAGGVIVWDRGEWVPLEDWREGLEKGKLLFELKGYKLKGKWTLVKIKKSEKDWLFIKERDAYLRSPGDQFPEESVLSGLTVEEVKTGRSDASALRREVEGAARPGPVTLRTAEVMLAEPRDDAFTREGWIFELKMDGYRMLAARDKGEVTLMTRNGNDYTRVFPEVARALRALPFEQFVMDGEIVALDSAGRPSFSLLQKRGSLTSEPDIRRLAVELPTTFYVFDLLGFEQMDLRDLTLVRRKAFLQRALPPVGAVRYLEHIETQGEAMLAQVGTMGLEGIVAKRADAPYRAGRSSQWLKIKAQNSGDFVVVGFTAPQGSRTGFGALQLADYVDGALVYTGRAGTGFTDRALHEIHAMLTPDIRDAPPCFGPVRARGEPPLPSTAIPDTASTTWVEPRHVCEVRYTEWTPDGVLRHPAFLRLRDDKRPHDCERQDWRHVDGGASNGAAATPQTTAPDTTSDGALDHDPHLPPRVVSRAVNISNPKKVFWPAEKYTKGDLIEYYRAIAPWLLPYLRDRPVVLTRFPDGIDGKSFYQKDAPEFAPEWMRTVPIWSSDTNRFIQYFVCDDVDGVVYLANSGTIPLHIWMSRVESLERPDWCVIDLDPKDAPFSDVVKTALVLHRLCGELGLPDYIKTTGKTGLHIMIPLGLQCTYEQSRTLGELLARLVIRELGDITTITRHVTRRGDKVYLDYLQNRHGQLIVSPFSVRPLPGATVSMPLTWDEVNQDLDPRRYTIRTAVDRMTTLGADPVRAVIDQKVDLAAVMTRLATLLTA
ncbi:MAG: DNA ligase D [Gemmatimonadaceae bacterium]|nr:DNA ligase D [Gemmatimonadaceae bacterium]